MLCTSHTGEGCTTAQPINNWRVVISRLTSRNSTCMRCVHQTPGIYQSAVQAPQVCMTRSCSLFETSEALGKSANIRQSYCTALASSRKGYSGVGTRSTRSATAGTIRVSPCAMYWCLFHPVRFSDIYPGPIIADSNELPGRCQVMGPEVVFTFDDEPRISLFIDEQSSLLPTSLLTFRPYRYASASRSCAAPAQSVLLHKYPYDVGIKTMPIPHTPPCSRLSASRF